MAEQPLALSSEERQYLVGVLKARLGETRVEERRTDTPAFQQQVREEENLIRSLLAKLGSRG